MPDRKEAVPTASTQIESKVSPIEPEPRRGPATAERDANPYIDAPFIEIGKLAMMYARRDGYVVCDDVLNDRRHVSMQANVDSPSAFDELVRAYGYQVSRQGSQTFVCGVRDPLVGVITWLAPNPPKNVGPIIGVRWNGRDAYYDLAGFASANNLAVDVDGCSYRLRDANGRVVRVLTLQSCLVTDRGSQGFEPATLPQKETVAETTVTTGATPPA